MLCAYPNFLDKPLLELSRDEEKICNYIDIPFQHINQSVLRRMRRGKGGSAVRETVDRLRETIPDLTLRTSLIVGFPGETDDDFQELLDFVEEAQFERLGVFKYSDEEGTTAALMAGKVSDEQKEYRWQELMDVQAQISRKKNEAFNSRIQRVMIDNCERDSEKLIGRTQGHAPEVDGIVYIECDEFQDRKIELQAGEMVDVRFTGALDYDLIGKIIHGY